MTGRVERYTNNEPRIIADAQIHNPELLRFPGSRNSSSTVLDNVFKCFIYHNLNSGATQRTIGRWFHLRRGNVYKSSDDNYVFGPVAIGSVRPAGTTTMEAK